MGTRLHAHRMYELPEQRVGDLLGVEQPAPIRTVAYRYARERRVGGARPLAQLRHERLVLALTLQ